MVFRRTCIGITIVILGSTSWAHECEVESIANRPAVWFELHTPIGDDFRRALDERTSHDLEAWTAEILGFYLSDGRLVYRGVCDDAGRTVEDFLHLFESVGPELLSKQSGNSFHSATPAQGDFNLRRSINADMSRFNHDAFLFALYQEALVHQKGPVGDNKQAYENSYGFSTSWSFWMAAEFAGVYPGEAPCANSVVFGLFPARHFLDYATLEAVDTRFKRLYPDERETLGAGGVDPDSVMLVARLETRPDRQAPVITETMLRDPQRPTRVLYFQGGLDPFDEEVQIGWDAYLKDETEIQQAIREYGVEPQTPPTVPQDSLFRTLPGKQLVLTRGGQPAKADRIYQLDFDEPVFPSQTAAEQD